MNESDIPQFRLASPQDFPAIFALEQWAHTHPWSETICSTMLNTRSVQCWLMEQGNNIIGFYFVQSVGDEATLLDIVVAPEMQGKGYGRILLNHLIELLELDTVETIFLEVRVSNFSAIALYLSCGFSEVGQRLDYYPTCQGGREDALIMALPLGFSLNIED